MMYKIFCNYLTAVVSVFSLAASVVATEFKFPFRLWKPLSNARHDALLYLKRRYSKFSIWYV